MKTPTDKTRRLRLPPIMRPRRTWSTSSREDAMCETISTLALAAKSGGDLLSALRLTGQSPTIPLGSHPMVLVIAGTTLTSLGSGSLLMPMPFALLSLLCFVLLFYLLRAGALTHRNSYQTRLLTVELNQALADEMGSGVPLSEAMSRFPDIFGPDQCTAVKNGERAGDVRGALLTLYRDLSVRQSGKTIDVLRIYFLLSLFFLTSISVFLIGRVFPRFIDIFEALGVPLSQLQVGLFHFMISSHVVPVALVVVICVLIDMMIRQHFGRLVTVFISHMILLAGLFLFSGNFSGIWFILGMRGGPPIFQEMLVEYLPLVVLLLLLAAIIPLISDLIRGAVCAMISWFTLLIPSLRRRVGALERAMFFDTLGRMLHRQIPAAEALRAAAPTLAPAGLQGRALRAADLVERGVRLDDALLKLRLLDRREAALLQLAAHAGQLPQKCEEVGEWLAQEARDHIMRRERLLRPLAVLFLGGCVFTLLITIYYPIFLLPTVIH